MMATRGMRLLAWWLLAVLVAAGFAQLGRWQLARMHEKQAMLAAAGKALDHGHPQPLRRALESARRDSYDWAQGRGKVLDATVWLDNQQREGRVGVRMYCVLLPDADAGAQPLLVDAGWWPLAGDRQLPDVGCPQGDGQVLRGLLAPPPSAGLAHGPALQAQGDRHWLASRLEMAAIGATLRLPAEPAPRVLRLDPQRQRGDAGLMAAPGQRDLAILPNTLTPERHLGYAVQWFGLALTVLATALILTFKKKS